MLFQVAGFAATSVPRVLSQGNTGVNYFSLGEIQVGDVVPGTYALCWCSSAACSEAADFMAYAGEFSLLCAPGYPATHSISTVPKLSGRCTYFFDFGMNLVYYICLGEKQTSFDIYFCLLDNKVRTCLTDQDKEDIW